MDRSYVDYMEPLGIDQIDYNPLPAVAIGGPPHSGKSVLTYSLTQALRLRDVPHYVIRAYPPDSEGDWFLGPNHALVRDYRVKGARSESWLPTLIRDIARRHLPCIVDLGGLPTEEQEAIIAGCTHGVLLTRGGPETNVWRRRFAQNGLVLLANLISDLEGTNQLHQVSPVLRGRLAGLERGHLADGPAFMALLDRLGGLFGSASRGLQQIHLAHAPADLVVDLAKLAHRLDVDPRAWPPSALPDVLDYLPQGQPLAFYGRGPNWLYAAVAAHTYPAAFYLFDARRGWIGVPALRTGQSVPDAAVTTDLQVAPGHAVLGLHLWDAYLDIDTVEALSLPPLSDITPTPDTALILSGRLPLWLWSALARAYEAPRLAILQPQLGGAVLIRDTLTQRIGKIIHL